VRDARPEVSADLENAAGQLREAVGLLVEEARSG
jgi:hypothetical protein